MNPLDTHRAAVLLIKQHGKNALSQVAEQMLEMRQAGDDEGEAVWGRVFNAIQDLQASRPVGGGQTLH